jgi:hypothetical protein
VLGAQDRQRLEQSHPLGADQHEEGSARDLLGAAASKTWRRLKGTNQLPKVIAGVRFENGIEVIQVPANHAA